LANQRFCISFEIDTFQAKAATSFVHTAMDNYIKLFEEEEKAKGKEEVEEEVQEATLEEETPLLSSQGLFLFKMI